MCRRHLKTLFSSVILVFFCQELGYGQAKEQAKEEEPSFQWLSALGETVGLKYATHKLQPLSLQNLDDAPVMVEQEEMKVDPQTTRITRRVYADSVNGPGQLTEMIVEEIRKLPGGRVQAVRTTSRKDISGRFSTVQQETQEMMSSGTDAIQIKKILFVPGINGALAAKEQIQQTERRKGDTAVDIDRTFYVTDPGGAWRTVERRVSQNSLSKERTRTEEQVYQLDVNNRLSLTRQIKVTESKDASGQITWQSEAYAPENIGGRFRLDSRTTVVQKPLENGRQETTETYERPSPAAAGEGLKPARKLVQNLQNVGANETETQLEVLELDLNSQWRTLHSRQRTDVK
jgi:hypothetical protein